MPANSSRGAAEERFAGDSRAAAPNDAEAAARAKVLEIDGWTALNAGIPPRERRGLVVIDPPYEQPDDFARVADATVGRASQMADRHLSHVVPDQALAKDRIASEKPLQRAGIRQGIAD